MDAENKAARRALRAALSCRRMSASFRLVGRVGYVERLEPIRFSRVCLTAGDVYAVCVRIVGTRGFVYVLLFVCGHILCVVQHVAVLVGDGNEDILTL